MALLTLSKLNLLEHIALHYCDMRQCSLSSMFVNCIALQAFQLIGCKCSEYLSLQIPSKFEMFEIQHHGSFCIDTSECNNLKSLRVRGSYYMDDRVDVKPPKLGESLRILELSCNLKRDCFGSCSLAKVETLVLSCNPIRWCSQCPNLNFSKLKCLKEVHITDPDVWRTLTCATSLGTEPVIVKLIWIYRTETRELNRSLHRSIETSIILNLSY